ncbi:MAG TPA: glycosyltransferase [Candidatus Paceibacterota bacterium]|nr:glycosyltransferase [Candidatus Paceibacterota bacterium]
MNHPYLYSFTVFVTVFQLTRLAGAMFHTKSLKRLLGKRTTPLYLPLVTFVIPCKNEQGAIEKTISKCFAAEYPEEKLEVIIINDGSTDNTIDIINRLKKEKFPKLVVIDWKVNQGKRHAMAEGFKIAKGEIIVQLDSDSYIDPKTFYNLIAPFKNPEIGAVCAHADPENADENMITRMQAAYYYMSFRIMKAAESTFYTVFCASGCSSAYRKDVVLPIMDAWLNEQFMGTRVTYGDDRSLTNWILKLGYKSVYTDYVQAYTIVPNNMKQLLTQQLRWKKSWIINAFFTSKFIFKKDPLIGIFYFVPLIFISFITPIIAFSGVILFPIVYATLPYYYILGTFLVTTLFILYYIYTAPKNKYWAHLYIWQLLNTVLFSYMMFYAIYKIKDRGWGTR